MLIFTDGSYSKKPNMCGLGAVILYNNEQIKIGSYNNKCNDNNIAEIAAIALAIHYIKNNNIVNNMSDKTINIISDSSYAVRKLSMRNSYGRDEVEQKYLDYILNFLNETNKKVSFLLVKGHSKSNDKLSFYNNMADNIAKEERLKGLQLYLRKNKKKNHNNINLLYDDKYRS